MNRNIADSGNWQVQLQRLPVIPVVPGYVNSKFGSGEEKPLSLRIFPNRTQKCR